jgi:zinc transport system ATP-binding protein
VNNNLPSIIEIENISYSYDNIMVLKDVTLSIEKGDFVGLIGPNGSGKTTLIKIILGIIKPKKGKILLLQRNINRFNNWEKIGYVPQKATSIDKNFPATVKEIVTMGLLAKKKLPKFNTESDEIKVQNALKKVNMEKFSDRMITLLSGGQQQRVLIAKAIVTMPEVLILDEPTAGIDQENQKSFYDLLGTLNKEGITIVLVSHDIGRITQYVTKIASINQKLIFYGSHREFCSLDKAHNHEHDHEHSLCLDKG